MRIRFEAILSAVFGLLSLFVGGIALADTNADSLKTVTVTATAVNQAAEIDTLTGQTACSTTLSNMVAGDVVTFEGAGDEIFGIFAGTFNPVTATTLAETTATTATVNGTYRSLVGGLTAYRARLSAIANGSTPTIVTTCGNGSFGLLVPSSGGGGGSSASPQPTFTPISSIGPHPGVAGISYNYGYNGTNGWQALGLDGLGNLNVNISAIGAGTLSVQPASGNFWQATQPVSLASTVNVHSTDATPVPCATPYGTGVCNQHSVDLISEAGPTTLSANGTTSPLSLSGAHTLCKLNLTAPFTGQVNISASKDGTTNFNNVDIYPKDAPPVTTLYVLSGAAADFNVPVSGMHGAEMTVANYGGSGTATLNCDVAPSEIVRSVPVSGGVPVTGVRLADKMTYPSTIPTTTAAETTCTTGTPCTNYAITTSSGSGFVVGEAVTITGSDSNVDTPTITYISGSTMTFNSLSYNHVSGSTITPLPTQTFTATLFGFENTCKTVTSGGYVGNAVSSVSLNGNTFSSTPAISDNTTDYNRTIPIMNTDASSWSTIVASDYAYKLTITNWTSGAIASSCDVGVRYQGPVIIGNYSTAACPAPASTPLEVTGGPNGVRVTVGATGGSITGARYPSSSATAAPTSLSATVTYAYPYVVSQSILLASGQSFWVSASATPCSIDKF